MSDLDNVHLFVEAYNRAESERVGYGFKSQWVTESDESLALAVAEAEARGYQRAIDALRYGQRIADRAWQANTASANYSLRDAADYLVQRAEASAQTAEGVSDHGEG